jgi:hypothetical protein
MIKKLTVIAIILASALSASSQAFESWLMAKVKLPAKFSLLMQAQYTTQEDVTVTRSWNVSGGVAYKVNSHLSLGAGYWYWRFRTNYGFTSAGDYYRPYWTERHRWYAEATGSMKLWQLSLSLRERYQWTMTPPRSVGLYTGADCLEAITDHQKMVSRKRVEVLRSRVQAVWQPAHNFPLAPYANFELFSQLGGRVYSTDRTLPAKFCSRWRCTVGANLRLDSHHSVGAYFRFVDVPYSGDSDVDNVIGLNYTLSL